MELYQFKLTELTVEGADDPGYAHMLEERALPLLVKELTCLVLSIKNIDFSRWVA